jgi:hypothetical protein
MTTPKRTKPTISAILLSVLLAASTVTLAACDNTAPRADSEINYEIQAMVKGDPAIEGNRIETRTVNGVVTLSGTVPSEAQRRVAAADAATVQGVRTVVNNLTVVPAQSAAAPPPQAAPRHAAKPKAVRRADNTENDVQRRKPPAEVHHATYAAAPAPAPAPPAYAEPPQREVAQADERAYPPPAARAPRYVRIPQGTPIPIRILDPVSSETALPGDTFRATVNFPVQVDGEIVIPVGSDVLGRVMDAQSAGKFKGAGFLAVELMRVSYNGHSYVIHTDEWSQQTTGRGKNTAAKVGGGAALGAIIGSIAGGGKGAGIGALVGAGAGGTAQAVTHGKQVNLEPEAQITFRLAQPVTVRPSAVNRRDANRRRLD